MDLDSNSIVTGLLKEYINPKYPVYKVKYIHTYLKENLDYDINNDLPFKLKSKILTRLMECRYCSESQNENSIYCEHGCSKICVFRPNGHIIFPKTIEEFENKKIIEDFTDNTDHFTIIDIKRVA